jgi:phosphatidate cytidylyltransferase
MTASEPGRPAPARGGETVARVISSLVLGLLALLAALAGGWPAATFLAIALGIVHLEWARITDRSPWPTAVFTAGLVVAVAMVAVGYVVGGLMIVAIAIGTSALTMRVWRPVGVAYVSTLGIGLLLIRLSPDEGLRAVLLILLAVVATDTAAYFVGRAIGGAKLWPAVSPNKTRAGAIGGLAGAVLVGTAAALVMGLSSSPQLIAVIAGLSVASQAGDLFESWVKRRFGVKDSGRLIPGHGGLMDRVDGLVFATAFALAVGWLHGGADLAAGLILW